MQFKFNNTPSELDKLTLALNDHIDNELTSNGFADFYGPSNDKMTKAVIITLLQEEKKQNKNIKDFEKVIKLNDEEYILSKF